MEEVGRMEDWKEEEDWKEGRLEEIFVHFRFLRYFASNSDIL